MTRLSGLLIRAIDAKDPYTAGHSERVMQYSVALGQRLGLSAKELATLQRGALVHDIGKIGVPDGILTKPDKLTDEEFEIVKLAGNWLQDPHEYAVVQECCRLFGTTTSD